jgi:hypothetical protein
MSKAFGYKPHLGPAAQHYLNGGEVKHFFQGGGDPMGSGAEEIMSVADPEAKTMMERVTNEPDWKVKERVKREQEAAKKKASETPVAPTKYNQAEEADSSFGIIPRTAPTPTGKPLPEQVPVEDKYDRYLKMAEDQMSASKKQRESDNNMAMIAAGLGIFGGDSPYAAVNIGKGGLHGVQYLSEANKQRAAEENAALGRIGSLMRYKELGEQNKQNREYIKEQKELDRGARVKAQDEQSLLSYQKIKMAPYEARAKLAISDEDRVKILSEGEQALYNDPRFLKKLGKYDPDLATLTYETPKKGKTVGMKMVN